MKRLSTALAATALVALAGCGSHAVNNAAIVDTSNDVYNVSPDDLTANVNDLGNGATGGNMSGGNMSSGSGNMSSGNMSSGNSHAASGNSSSSHGSASHATRNSH